MTKTGRRGKTCLHEGVYRDHQIGAVLGVGSGHLAPHQEAHHLLRGHVHNARLRHRVANAPQDGVFHLRPTTKACYQA